MNCIYKYATILLSKNDPLHSDWLSEIISKNNSVRGQRTALANSLKKNSNLILVREDRNRD